jgi:ADP-ribosyl-[dinitrogen reductase] hydrolase
VPGSPSSESRRNPRQVADPQRCFFAAQSDAPSIACDLSVAIGHRDGCELDQPGTDDKATFDTFKKVVLADKQRHGGAMPRELQLLTFTAIGDAYGVCFEYAPREIIRARNNLAGYFRHHKYQIGGGRYSDDTQMSIAVAETLLNLGHAASARDFAASFVAAFQRDPREGYAGRFHEFLLTVTDADDFLARIRNDSDKSGGAMRAGACGLLGSVEVVKSVAARQAAVTHDTSDGIAAAQAAALMVHYLLYHLGPRRDLPHFLDMHVPGYGWSRTRKGSVGAKGCDSVGAAITALVRNQSVADLLLDCVNFGGDVDTVAAIAMAAAACADDIVHNVPESLWSGLENGRFGRDRLIVLDQALQDFAKRQGAPME